MTLTRFLATFTWHFRASSLGGFRRLLLDYFGFSLVLKGFNIGQEKRGGITLVFLEGNLETIIIILVF